MEPVTHSPETSNSVLQTILKDSWVWDCHTIPTFLQNLLNACQSQNRKYSANWLSMKLKWPRSLISDVLAGRKLLSIERTHQLINVVKIPT
ncbi:MAG: hypothetical protein AAF203_02855, partial [Pseudomonadota bacterium]